MTKQLDDMWTTKWVLPEHKDALIKDERSLKRIIKPELDEQEVAAIDQAINNAQATNSMIILTMYGKYELKTIVGTVFKINPNFKMIKIKYEDPTNEHDECVWLQMRDILKAEIQEVEEWNSMLWE